MSMYAALGVWDMQAGDWQEQQRSLNEQVVPTARQVPGFVSGYWMVDKATGKTHTTIILEDEEAAQRFKELVSGSERQQRQEEAGVRPESMTLVEVLAEAHR